MPSLRETGGVVLAEAIVYNIPIVTLRAFGSRLFLNDTNSILYNSSDFEEFKKVILRIMDKDFDSFNIKKTRVAY